MIRKALDGLYLGAGILAAIALVAIAVLTLAQIVGRWFGVIVPSTEDFAGYALAAATFLALAYTLRLGGHIRVTLVLHTLPPRIRFAAECLTLCVALLVAGYVAYSCIALVIESYEFEELSSGYIAVPIWIPQTPMAAGLAIFFVALADELFCLLRGGVPGYMRHEEADAVSEKIEAEI